MNPKQIIDFSCFKTLIVLIYIYNNYSLYFNIIYLVNALKLLITNQWGEAAVPRLWIASRVWQQQGKKDNIQNFQNFKWQAYTLVTPLIVVNKHEWVAFCLLD